PHCWAAILPPDRFSFPSGHSITAFAIAVCIGLFYPQLQDLLLFIAVCVAASRIILGMHFLSDVIAGSMIGAGLGFSAFRIFS
ncbi:MAG: phosphatase PAP2 family protein, partial [Candidatus Acidiferrales bacterium]